jgi:hypothetical protein
MSETNERSVASAGSVAVAWAAVWPEDGDGIDCGWVYDSEEDAIHAASGGDGIDGRRGVGAVVPLYRSPSLTDAERAAIAMAYGRLGVMPGNDDITGTLLALLSRTK